MHPAIPFFSFLSFLFRWLLSFLWLRLQDLRKWLRVTDATFAVSDFFTFLPTADPSDEPLASLQVSLLVPNAIIPSPIQSNPILAPRLSHPLFLFVIVTVIIIVTCLIILVSSSPFFVFSHSTRVSRKAPPRRLLRRCCKQSRRTCARRPPGSRQTSLWPTWRWRSPARPPCGPTKNSSIGSPSNARPFCPASALLLCGIK